MIIELLLGFVLLVVGGNALVSGSVTVARHFGVSELLIGLTLVGFGTSMPELVTSLNAALKEVPGIAVGNVVGSNIANILLILGVTAAITPVGIPAASMKRDGSALVLVTVLMVLLFMLGTLGRWAGIILISCLVAYIVYSYRRERQQVKLNRAAADADDIPRLPERHWVLGLLLAVVGIAVTVTGAHFLVEGAVAIARVLGVSETVIGLTLVAIGTSLPELAISIIAALRRNVDIAIGNVIGSNLYNICGILGITSLVVPLPIPASIMVVDIWVMVLATCLLIGFLFSGLRIVRWEGLTLLACYAAYIGWLAFDAGAV